MVELEELKGIRDRLAASIKRAEEELRAGQRGVIGESALVERRKVLADLERTIARLEGKGHRT